MANPILDSCLVTSIPPRGKKEKKGKVGKIRRLLRFRIKICSVNRMILRASIISF